MEEFDNGLGDKWDYDENTPVDTEVEIEKLKKFLKPTDTLIFYGGEPLVMIEKMKEIMDKLNCRFQMQSNGVLLNQLPLEYLMKLDKMLISIDGDKERTDYNRGVGKYDIITKNLQEIRKLGYEGEVVARMTLSFPDIFEQVTHLMELRNRGLFDSVHWQIDAEFYKFDYDKEKFSKFVEEYNESIDKLFNYWVEELERGNVMKIYPFLGVLCRVMGWDTETRLPCGSGYANYTINTKGDLSACPIMNSVKNFYCGSIEKGVNKEINCGGWCVGCEYLPICGGRCLYSNDAQLWPKEGHDLVCRTIKHLIDGVKEMKTKIEELLEKGVLKKEDFEYEKYFGPEIIP